MNGNDFVSWLLRSPFHGMLSNGTTLISVIGCKTGKTYTTPVGFYKECENIWILTSRDRSWWRNLKGGADVNLLLKREPVNGFAETVLEDDAVEASLIEYLRRIPQAARTMGIRVKNNVPNSEDVARVAKERLFVKVRVD